MPTLDTFNTSFNSDTPNTVDITIGNNANRCVVLMLFLRDTGSVTITGVSGGGGGTWTRLGSETNGNGDMSSTLFYSIGPSVGAQTLTMTLSGTPTGTWGVFAWSLYDVDQATPLENLVFTAAGSQGVTNTSGNLALSAQFDSSDQRTVSGCTTSLVDTGYTLIGWSAAQCTGAPSSTFTWSAFGTNSHAVGVSVRAAATGVTIEPGLGSQPVTGRAPAMGFGINMPDVP